MERTWKYEAKSYQIADSGDFDGHYEFTNGKITLISRTEVDEVSELDEFVAALNKFPDLYCQGEDSLEVELAIEKGNVKYKDEAIEELVRVLREAKIQIEYLHGKFKETGSGNNVLDQISTVLSNFKE